MIGSPSCSITVSDGLSSLTGTGRTDDGSGERIASPDIAQRTVPKGIGQFEKINPVSIKVSLTDKRENYTFYRVWNVPRLVMKLSSGRMALNNISFLSSDASLASEDILIDLPVLRHLGIDWCTVLESNHEQLDVTDCSTISLLSFSNKCGSLGRLMISHLQRDDDNDKGDVESSESDEEYTIDPNQLRSNYYRKRLDEDPFPNSNLMDLDSKEKTEQEKQDIADMLNRKKEEGLPKTHWEAMEALVFDFADCFSTRFSTTPSKADPLRIRLTPDPRPIRVKLRNYSPEQVCL